MDRRHGEREYSLFFNNTATTEIYTLSLHDALPISGQDVRRRVARLERSNERPPTTGRPTPPAPRSTAPDPRRDRKSTRLNSSHANISYAVFCLKKKKKSTCTSYTSYHHLAYVRSLI